MTFLQISSCTCYIQNLYDLRVPSFEQTLFLSKFHLALVACEIFPTFMDCLLVCFQACQ
ncbi:unnamed protein product [Trichogramma brassicae]|uniref:Uncharacterized protein n=1 Tax=Trichogramma brassicae TaxID=86971 RepID=A0A6H5IQ50_9HYME|nr:unnamed protein product [Trichogramma brassicae]